jgi:hypothetical protein
VRVEGDFHLSAHTAHAYMALDGRKMANDFRALYSFSNTVVLYPCGENYRSTQENLPMKTLRLQ